MTRRMPRAIRLSRTDERRITRLLSEVPTVRPTIGIETLAGSPFEVEYQEAEDFFVPLQVGSEGWSADYGALSGCLLEASHCRVARRLKVRGAWAYEAYKTGGSVIDGRFLLNWYHPLYYRVTARHSYPLSEYGIGRKLDRHLDVTGAITRIDSETLQGPEDPLMLPIDYATVTIDGRLFECIRALTITRRDTDPGDKASDPAPDYELIEETYISRSGRAVLSRRYETAAHRDLMDGFGMSEEASWPENRAHIRYNDTNFYHWFDVVSDGGVCKESGQVELLSFRIGTDQV